MAFLLPKEKRVMPELDKDTVKQALKEAMKEWIDERVTLLGWFTLKWLFGVVAAGIIWYAVKKDIL